MNPKKDLLLAALAAVVLGYLIVAFITFNPFVVKGKEEVEQTQTVEATVELQDVANHAPNQEVGERSIEKRETPAPRAKRTTAPTPKRETSEVSDYDRDGTKESDPHYKWDPSLGCYHNSNIPGVFAEEQGLVGVKMVDGCTFYYTNN